MSWQKSLRLTRLDGLSSLCPRQRSNLDGVMRFRGHKLWKSVSSRFGRRSFTVLKIMWNKLLQSANISWSSLRNWPREVLTIERIKEKLKQTEMTAIRNQNRKNQNPESCQRCPNFRHLMCARKSLHPKYLPRLQRIPKHHPLLVNRMSSLLRSHGSFTKTLLPALQQMVLVSCIISVHRQLRPRRRLHFQECHQARRHRRFRVQ